MPNLTPLAAMHVTTVDPATPLPDFIETFAAAMAIGRKKISLVARKAIARAVSFVGNPASTNEADTAFEKSDDAAFCRL
jgi:hypothetical protein